ncbi:hypothetical protein ACQ4M4_06155 [Leptolyngbya sp. AN02str]|uniref:hypothetical protein n=1 Tax=Leptolyngbya sp. AN02str TaxID=3423363 RepID=UPI003D32009E
MLLREGSNFLEMIATERIPEHLPAPGDTRFEIRVQSFGFLGQGWTWIDAVSLSSFVAQLHELEPQRQGSAEVSSMSPDQFWLKIFSTNRLGQMAVIGRLSQVSPLGHDLRCNHLLEFGFPFDPVMLPSIVKNFERVSSGVLMQG